MAFSIQLMATPSCQLLRPNTLTSSLTHLFLSPLHLMCQEILLAALSKRAWTPTSSPHPHLPQPHPRHPLLLLPLLLPQPLTFCFPLPVPGPPLSLLLTGSHRDSVKMGVTTCHSSSLNSKMVPSVAG